MWRQPQQAQQQRWRQITWKARHNWSSEWATQIHFVEGPYELAKAMEELNQDEHAFVVFTSSSDEFKEAVAICEGERKPMATVLMPKGAEENDTTDQTTRVPGILQGKLQARSHWFKSFAEEKAATLNTGKPLVQSAAGSLPRRVKALWFD